MTFAPRITYGDLDLTDAPFMVEFGFDLGNGQTVYEALTSLIRDGSIQVESRQENRTITLSVLVEAPDSVGQVTDGASVLAAELLADFNTLTFEPGDGFGSACVFETMAAQAEHDWDQDLEQAGLRRYVLTIPALPAIRSVDEVTVNVGADAAYTQILLTDALWSGTVSEYTVPTTADGPPAVATIGDRTGFTTSTAVSRDVLIDRPFLWVRHSANSPLSVSVDGVALSGGRFETFNAGGATPPYFTTYDVSAFLGRTVTLTLPSGRDIDRLFLIDYPTATSGPELNRYNPPRHIARIPVIGSARSPIRIEAPGAALIYTAPDPLEALATGMPEQVFGHFTYATGGTAGVGSQVSYWPAGTWSRAIGVTDAQPPELAPGGFIYSGVNNNGVVIVDGTLIPSGSPGHQLAGAGDTGTPLLFVYPADRDAAISYFPGSDALVISPRPSLPQGYHSQADAHETHSIHPSRSGYMGFAALDASGNPVAATITYYPRWRHHAGQ